MTPNHGFSTAPELEALDYPIRELDDSLADLDDSALLSLVRAGSRAAFGTLFVRYRYPAERLASYLGMGAEAPDVVSEAFAQMYDLIIRGKGPERAFRAYMFTTIRHEAGRRAKARRRLIPTDDAADLDTAVPFGGGRLDSFEAGLVRDAYESLPERWRSVLWALDVEDRTPAEVGQAHEMSANAVSALAYRARAGLRESYLQQHIVADDLADACRAHRERMVSVVRGTSKQRARDSVFAHLEGCAACDSAFEELTEINEELGLIGAPVALGVVGVGASGVAALYTGLLSALSTLKAHLVAVVVPALTVGALAVAPMIQQAPASASVHDPVRTPATTTVRSSHSSVLAGTSSTHPSRAQTKRVGQQVGRQGKQSITDTSFDGVPTSPASGQPTDPSPLQTLHGTVSGVVKGAAHHLAALQKTVASASTSRGAAVVPNLLDRLVHGGR